MRPLLRRIETATMLLAFATCALARAVRLIGLRAWMMLAAGALFATGFVSIADLVLSGEETWIDDASVALVRSLRSPPMDTFMRLATRTGDPPALVLVVALAAGPR